MTHEEKAREFVKKFTEFNRHDLMEEFIVSALAYTEKKAWNEAIEAARKVAEEHGLGERHPLQMSISRAIERLKK